MRLSRKKSSRDLSPVQTASRPGSLTAPGDGWDTYERVRERVPLIDAALSKIVRLLGHFTIECASPTAQASLETFLRDVPVGLSGQSIDRFIDAYLDSLLVYGNAVGEMVITKDGRGIAGLWNGCVRDLQILPGDSPLQREYWLQTPHGARRLPHPERILFTALKPPAGQIYGVSLLRGVVPLAEILLRIYECVGQNFDRAGNVRYAIRYKPSADPSDAAYASERAAHIAEEWSEGMRAAKHGDIRDFVSVGDVDIRVIGADNTMPATEAPVRQLLEQILSKFSIPPFLLGLSWSTTERMSAQQADILTSELEYYRRLLEPVIRRIADTYLSLSGLRCPLTIVWDSINLQDEVELARARLYHAQAASLESSS